MRVLKREDLKEQELLVPVQVDSRRAPAMARG
jgi:hypothetical protein